MEFYEEVGVAQCNSCVIHLHFLKGVAFVNRLCYLQSMNDLTNVKKLKMLTDTMHQSLSTRLLHQIFLRANAGFEKSFFNENRVIGFIHDFSLFPIKIALKHLEAWNSIEDLPQAAEFHATANHFLDTDLGKHFFSDVDPDADIEQIVNGINHDLYLIQLGAHKSRYVEKVGPTWEKDLDLFVSIYDILNRMWVSVSSMLKTSYWNEWYESLFKVPFLSKPKKFEGGRFLVHFMNASNCCFDRKGFISCNLISKNSPNAFQGRQFGYMFDIRDQDIFGMAPDDLCSQLECPDYLFDDVGNFMSLLFRETHFDNSNLIFYGHFMNMLPFYPLQEFERLTKPGDYNEVVLDGKTSPSAVFVFKEYLSESENLLAAACLACGLPLVVYDPVTDQAVVVPLSKINFNAKIPELL